MQDKYFTIIDICLIYYQSDVFTDLSCNKMFAFYYKMIAFSNKMFAFSIDFAVAEVVRFP